MKILNLSLDKAALDKNSSLARRIIEYGGMTDKYTMVVPIGNESVLKISDKVNIYGVGGRNKITRLLKLYFFAKNILKSEKYDVITTQDVYYLGFVAVRLAKKFNIGLEAQVHGWEKFVGIRKMLAGRTLKRADSVRVVSSRLKKQIIKDFGVAEEKITVAPIFVNLKTKILNLKSEKFKKDKFIFLTVGRLVPVKNIGLQIKAMAKVVESQKLKVKSGKIELWIIGDGPEKSNLKSKISSLKLENNVKLFGWQNNPEEFYSQADAFLLTSNSEGWGMVAVEAATHGLPIIMTDVGLAGEVIKNGESGIVIPVGNQAKLEEVMIKIIGDEDLRRRLAEGAISAIEKMPSKEETLALYKKSLEKAMKSIEIITQGKGKFISDDFSAMSGREK